MTVAAALRSVVGDFCRLDASLPDDRQESYHLVSAGIHQLGLAIRQGELAGLDASTVREILEPAIALHGQSPLINRLQTWPRGYPGDFETIEYLCGGENRAQAGTLSYYIEQVALHSAVTQQHRNKVAWQGSEILSVCLSGSNEKRILSIACGGSRDLRSVKSLLLDTKIKIFLNDMDPDALALSMSSLHVIRDRLTILPGDVIRATRSFARWAPFDVIVAGGLFDYLDDRRLEWLIPKLHACLGADGAVCFTNLARGNPARAWMEYLCNWNIIERSEEDILQIFKSSGLDNYRATIERDTTGLALLVKVRKVPGCQGMSLPSAIGTASQNAIGLGATSLLKSPTQEVLRLFAEIDPQTTDWILSAGEERRIARDEAIAVEGQELNALLFVLDGLFAVRLKGLEDAPVALLGPGELVGEISFLENLPATATVVASEDSRVLCIARVDLQQRIETDRTFAADLYRAFARVLSRRLRERSLALAASAADRRSSGLMAAPAWVSLVALLEAFKELLRRAEGSARHSDGRLPPELEDLRRKFDELCSGLTRLTREAPTPEVLAEAESALRREFVPYLHLTRLAHRVFTKPRGYAGDFLTIDWMYRNEPGGVAPLGPLVDRLFLDRPTARAVRNRRELLAEEIGLALDRRDGSTRVTSLACGPAQEIFDVFSRRPDGKLEATLIDIDFEALAFVADRRAAAGLTKSMRLEHANLVYLATGRSHLDLEQQDLVYSIGLIDYFDDRFVIALLNWIHGYLAPGGKVILGNFHTRNPDRALMDLVLDWKLIHRSEEDMNRLFEASSFGRPCTEIRYEKEEINLFACCVKD